MCWGGGCPGHCGMFSSIPGLCSVVKTRNVPRYCSCLIESHGWSSMKAGPGGVSRKHNSALSAGSPCVPCCEAQLAEAVASSDVPTQLSFKLCRSFGAATGRILPQGAFLQSSALSWSPGSPTRIHDVSIWFQCGGASSYTADSTWTNGVRKQKNPGSGSEWGSVRNSEIQRSLGARSWPCRPPDPLCGWSVEGRGSDNSLSPKDPPHLSSEFIWAPDTGRGLLFPWVTVQAK